MEKMYITATIFITLSLNIIFAASSLEQDTKNMITGAVEQNIKTVAFADFINVTTKKPVQEGDILISQLTSIILADKKLQIVERDRLDKVLIENKISLSDYVDQKMSTKIGKIVGAEGLIYGSAIQKDKTIIFTIKLVKVSNGLIAHSFTYSNDGKFQTAGNYQPKGDIMKKYAADDFERKQDSDNKKYTRDDRKPYRAPIMDEQRRQYIIFVLDKFRMANAPLFHKFIRINLHKIQMLRKARQNQKRPPKMEILKYYRDQKQILEAFSKQNPYTARPVIDLVKSVQGNSEHFVRIYIEQKRKKYPGNDKQNKRKIEHKKRNIRTRGRSRGSRSRYGRRKIRRR